MAKKRVMLVVPMLDQGGLERVCALTAQLLKTTYEVHLVVFNTTGMIYDVSGVHLIDLHLGAVPGKLGKLTNLFKRAKRLSMLQKELQIDVMYSFGQTANMASALSGGKARKIAACHSFGEIHNEQYMKLILKKMDYVVCCAKAMAEEVRCKYQVKDIQEVWNPCDISGIRELGEQELPDVFKSFFEGEEKVILSMGREHDVKGFWHLLKAFKRVQEEMPKTKLAIVGEGSFDEYKRLAVSMGIQEKVLFAGMQKNPFSFMKASDIYALSSISEGLPNALVEALTEGLPIVSVNCKSGPAEILHDNWKEAERAQEIMQADYGILTPPLTPQKNIEYQSEGGKIILEAEEEALAQAMLRMLQDQTLYQQYRELTAKRAQDFSMEKYKEAIIRLIEA